jgi:hypothetical protein
MMHSRSCQTHPEPKNNSNGWRLKSRNDRERFIFGNPVSLILGLTEEELIEQFAQQMMKLQESF